MDKKDLKKQAPNEPAEQQDPNTPAQPQVPPVVTEDVNNRISPALEVLKELMSRAEEKRTKSEEAKQAEEQVKYAAQNAQVVQPMPGQIYVSLDGDNIGNAVARAEANNDEKTLADVSRRINFGQQVLTDWAHRMGGKLIEGGGDEGLVKVPGTAMDMIEQLRVEYKKMVGASCTIGVGQTISESTKARMLGKLRGKNRTVVFDEGTEAELDLRLENRGDETPEKKISESGVLAGQGKPQEPAQPQSQPQPSIAPEQQSEVSDEELEGEQPPKEEQEVPVDDGQAIEHATPAREPEENSHADHMQSHLAHEDRLKKARDFQKKTGVDVRYLTSLLK